MSQALSDVSVTCPYCYSEMTKEIEVVGGEQQVLYEDCEVCCAPMELSIRIDEEGEIRQVRVRPGNS
ncbi:MAG: CPXCG motif-containing cysteine-rich protein [Thiothrix sp.]|nr:CPXCG motif-containing cysteine-rich protein [Thiothrix sp.]HPQ94671.1 CPXCG motif-containing cysteine-rich protein [Thiolinea sp.]